MKKPVLSDRFDEDDIRKLREYNDFRYKSMADEEILLDIKNGAKEGLELIEKLRKEKETLV